MRFGTIVPIYGPLARPYVLRRLILCANALGHHALWFADHSVVPDDAPGLHGEICLEHDGGDISRERGQQAGVTGLEREGIEGLEASSRRCKTRVEAEPLAAHHRESDVLVLARRPGDRTRAGSPNAVTGPDDNANEKW